MSRLRIAWVVIDIALFALFHILYITGMAPFAYVNILFLIVAFLGYFTPTGFSYILGLLIWPVLYPLFAILYKIDPLNAFLSIAVFNGMQISFIKSRRIISDYHNRRDRHMSEALDRKKKLADDFDNLKKFEQGSSQREMDIVSLYEVTRRMSESLRLDGIFNILSSFLAENFKFRRCSLLVLGKVSEPAIERIFSVWQKGETQVDNEKVHLKESDYAGLITKLNAESKVLSISKAADRPNFKELNIDSDVTSLVAAPLLSENKMVAALVIEDLPKDDIDKFAILAMQFALEIKKVLLYEMVEKLAITDSLTGLYLRRYFSERLKEELERSERYKLDFALLMIDIDDFKSCNDSYGHLVGDVVLKDVSAILKESVREIDIVARYGGEEFAVILSETPREGALVVAERIRKRMEGHLFKAYDEKIKATVSIGVSIYPKDSKQEKDLIDKADMALYAAKRSGKNLVREYKKEYNGTQ